MSESLIYKALNERDEWYAHHSSAPKWGWTYLPTWTYEDLVMAFKSNE